MKTLTLAGLAIFLMAKPSGAQVRWSGKTGQEVGEA